MNKSLSQQFKKNIIILSIVITVIFIIINISLFIINNTYLVNKVKEENQAFLLITTHIINENDIDIALEYVEHYTHIHLVNIEITDSDDTMLFSSNVAHLYTSRYTIETLKGTFTVFIDNSESITVTSVENNTIYVNISLLVIYILALFVIVRMNKENSNHIQEDIRGILDLMNTKTDKSEEFNHIEFEKIYNTMIKYLENIDLLTEQKEMNMKGLAHDIKTPLTIVYSFFERVIKNDNLTQEDKLIAFESSKRINDLLNDIIENNERTSIYSINISKTLLNTINEYSSIFENKGIIIHSVLPKDVTYKWNDKDFSRVIDNIISNAYYYSKKNTIFEIKLIKEEKIKLEFTSTPVNIEDINTETIFKQGARGNLSNLENSYGKGFGLYLCRLLLSSIDGDIEVDIENKNVKFTIIL